MSDRIGGALLALAFLGLLTIGGMQLASQRAEGQGAVFVVNTTSDHAPGACEDSPGDCTLREAINAANLTTGGLIWFDIAGCPPACTIAVGSALPAVTAVGTAIDGKTEPEYEDSPLVVIDGGATPIGFGLRFLGADGGALMGVAVQGFTSRGVVIESDGFVIADSAIVDNFTGVFVNGDAMTLTRNHIAGSGRDGITVEGGSGGTATKNTIVGNGAVDESNGILVCAAGWTIEDNLIEENSRSGVTTNQCDQSHPIVVSDNTIVRSGVDGISLSAGGEVTENIISDNGREGVFVFDGLTEITGNTITGNGATNSRPTVEIQSQAKAVIRGNVISDNEGVGIELEAVGNVVGGSEPGEGNVISGNGSAGILVLHAFFQGGLGAAGTKIDSVDNTISGNSIFGNGGLGIDLAPIGVTENDAGDDDGGANRRQNFPVLVSAVASSPTVTGAIDSRPEANIRVEFFVSDACDPDGFGEGAEFIGAELITLPVSGMQEFTVSLDSEVTPGEVITSTATNLGTGDTSEFSNCVTVTPQGVPTPTPEPTGTPGPTATPTPTPSQTPGPTGSATPTATPGGKPLAGDLDCDGDVDAVDALALLRHVAGLPPLAQQEPCPDVGSAGLAFGDLDCDGDIDAVDALAVLRFVAGLSPLAQQEPCTDVGA